MDDEDAVIHPALIALVLEKKAYLPDSLLMRIKQPTQCMQFTKYRIVYLAHGNVERSGGKKVCCCCTS